jgi:MFS family permease
MKRLSRNVVTLGFVSLLNDMASEMLYPIMPLFLTTVLGASPAILGLIDGVADWISSALRWIGGALSDRYRRRKPFVVFGYGLSAISKPLLGVAAYTIGWPLYFAGRCGDRLGKATRTAARDALIVDSTEADTRGAAFGLHRAMDSTGAVIGPLILLLILWFVHDKHLEWVFLLSIIPGAAATLLAGAAVKDIPHEEHPDATPPPLLQHYSRPLWQLFVAAFVFALGNSSDSFLLLRAKDVGMSFRAIVLAYALYMAIYAIGSYPLGRVSDRIGRKPVIVLGWLIYACVYFGFAIIRSASAIWPLLAIYGLYQALTDGVTKALVGDFATRDQRAGAIGLFNTATGFGQLIASLLVGWLWYTHVFNGRFSLPFLIGAAFALLAVPMILLVGRND